MTSTTTKIAIDIYQGAKDAGATRDMLASYDLTREDCAYVRETYLGDSDASECSDEEMRQVILAVEAEVRSIAAASA